MNFKTVFSPLNEAWDVDKISIEIQKRGLVTSDDRQTNLEAFQAWQEARQETLPLKRFINDGERANAWSDGSQILDHELVLERTIRNSKEHPAPQAVDKRPMPEVMEKNLGPEGVELNLAPVIMEEDPVPAVVEKIPEHGITRF